MITAWYSVRVLFESRVCSTKTSNKLLEEKWVVLKSTSPKAAYSKAKIIAKSHEDHYKNANGNMVDVTFKEVLEVQEIMGRQIKDGAEVFFRFWHNPTKEDMKFLRQTHEKT